MVGGMPEIGVARILACPPARGPTPLLAARNALHTHEKLSHTSDRSRREGVREGEGCLSAVSQRAKNFRKLTRCPQVPDLEDLWV